MIAYPKYLYGADNAVVLVQNAAEHDAIEGNWYESPADVPEAGAEAASRAELEAKATELGIEFNGRNSDRTLLKLIAEAEAKV